MADIVLSVASKVAEYLVAPVGRQCGYVIFSDSYVNQLNGEVEKLGDARVEVQHRIDEAERNMKRIEPKVEKWVKEAETITNTARSMLGNDGRAKKTCFCRWLPNPKERYCLGRNARKTVQTIQALIPQGKFERIYYESAPPGLVGSPPDVNLSAGGGGNTIADSGLFSGASDVNSSAADGGDTIADSRASIMQGIMEALDDEKLKVIGVYGPGGVGKTTLLKQVKETLKKKGRPFDMIVTAEVSLTPDLINIQGQIADALSLSLKDKETQQGRRDHLLQRLQSNPNEKVLIILDDLWKELNLEAVGIPSGNTSGKCKLLLASRFKDVLEQKMLADRTFFLESLNNNEAFMLFEKTVGDRLKDDKQLKAIAAQLVNKLAGLPLLNISIAKTLKNSCASAWRNALIKIDEPNTETIVKLSYEHLKSEDAKTLFLLCSLIGGTIQVETLLVLGMCLGLFEEFDEKIQGARDRLNTLLDSLRSICLLQDGGNNKKNVTIHDLYSEVVVSTPFEGENSLTMNNNYCPRTKEKLEKCWAICLVDVGSDRLTELMRCAFPELKILMLSPSKNWGERPAYQHGVGDKLDFTYMKELRVLYLCSMYIPTSLSSIEILGNLWSFYLDYCDVGDVAILGKLKALRILSFARSQISKLPKEIGHLTNLRSLNLSNCVGLKIIEPGALKGLINLEELHMKQSFDQWMGVDEIQSESCNATLAELKSLTKLTSLEISIPNPTILLEGDDLPFGNLINFQINIGNAKLIPMLEHKDLMVGYEGLSTMKIRLKGCDSILSRECVKKTLQNTQYLHLDGMREFKKNAHELCAGGFPQLKCLNIEDSPSIKYITSSSNSAFPNLEFLFLSNLINLEKICHDFVGSGSLSKLKIVRVFNCDQLKYLWCLSQMQRLVHLEEISVTKCNSMRAIASGGASTVNIVKLLKVRRLLFQSLPKMTSFCTEAGITSEGAPLQVSFPCLEDLVMNELLDLEKILYSQPPLEYSNLKSIKIWSSKSTSSILKSDWILMLPNLESLNISYSQSTNVVFNLSNLKVTRHVEILSRLEKLVLIDLSNLQHIWKQDVQLQGVSAFRNLKELMVYKTRLAFLFPVSVAKCLREIRDIEVTFCPNMKAVIVDEEGRDEGTDDIIEFPLLKRLCIINCAMEKFFSCPSGKKDLITTTSYSQDAYSDSFFNQKVSFPNIRELEIEGTQCKELWNNQIPNDSFCKLESLKLKRCDNLQHIAPSHMWKRLQCCLENLKVISCHSIEIIYEGDGMDTGSGKLKTLILSHLDNLGHIWQYNGLPIGEEIEYIDVEHCRNMEVLIVDERGRDGGMDDIIEFPLLRRLHINDCPLKKFFSCPHGKKESEIITSNSQDTCADSFFDRKVTFPDIKFLEIEGAQCKELWNNQIPNDSFCKLESLKLKRCDNLQRIAPSHMWKRLQCYLENLEVISCCSIKIIYEGDGMDIEGGKLTKLVLRDLKNLGCIWQCDGLPNIPFPNLRDVEVVRCSHLEMLFPTFTAKFLSQIEDLMVESCEDMKQIAGHEKSEEAIGTTVTFSELIALRLFELPKFRSFLPEGYSLKFSPCYENFPSLEVLSIESCGSELDQFLDYRDICQSPRSISEHLRFERWRTWRLR